MIEESRLEKKSSRRDMVPFDPYYFESQKKEGAEFSVKETFRKIYVTRHWTVKGSVSGAGSETSQTAALLLRLKSLLPELHVKHLLDIPCGDFNWIKNLYLPDLLYTGGDIVQDLIVKNSRQYGSYKRIFLNIDLISGRLPAADLLLCRDCLVHFSFNDIFKAIRNIKKYRIKYFLTTTFEDCRLNEDIITGDWRPINLGLEPFNFPEPIELINENCTEGEGIFGDKSMGLWRIKDLPDY